MTERNVTTNGARPPGRPSFEASDRTAAAAFRKQIKNVVLSRSSSEPLWHQLQDQLERLIQRGALAPKSRLPSEPVLCDMFHVSRPVVRSAINALTSRGLVVKIPRKGTFVGEPQRESGFVTSNISLFEDMLARGAEISTQTFEWGPQLADAHEMQALQLQEGEQVVRIRRLFIVDGKPITYSRMSFPAHKVPEFHATDTENKSILGLIRERYGRRVVRAERNFSAIMPTQVACERMGVNSAQPLIWIESIGFEKDGSPLEYYRAFYNSEAATVRISVSD